MSKVLYSKYRPKYFDEVVGQDNIIVTLKNQLKTDRIANAYLFCGLRGSGKTSVARILARAINCESPTIEPCYNCSSCNRVDNNPDIIEIDAASNNSVDNIRNLIDEVHYKPTYSSHKVYIIDEIHMLSNSAFNALLKILEEPPEHAVFILATTESNKVPMTIKSRCQVYTFKNISPKDMSNHLKEICKKESVDYEDEAIYTICRKASGSLRDAISILEQAIVHNTNNIITLNGIYELLGEAEAEIILKLDDCIDNAKVGDGLDILHEQYNNGKNLKSLFENLYSHYYNKYASALNGDMYVDMDKYVNLTKTIAKFLAAYDKSTCKSILADITFVNLCIPEKSDIKQLMSRVEALEQGISVGNKEEPIVENVNEGYISVEEDVEGDAIIYYNNTYNHEIIIQ